MNDSFTLCLVWRKTEGEEMRAESAWNILFNTF